MKSFSELKPLIIKWAKEKGILEKATPIKQLLKTKEEITELLTAMEDNNHDEVKDALGDIFVTLIIYSKMKDLNPFVRFEKAGKNNVVPNSTDFSIEMILKTFNALFLDERKNPADTISKIIIIEDMVFTLSNIARFYRFDLEECLESAYDVIKNRTGKMINGQFVKDN